MKKVKKFVSFLLCASLLIPYSSAFAMDNTSEESATIEDIYSSTPKTIYISPETKFTPKTNSLPQSGDVQIMTYGSYPIYTRVRTIQSSSNGLLESDSEIGNYASIASIALSFSNLAAAMTVSTIFSVVGLAVSQNTYAQAKTFTSYVQYRKQGEARWSDESAYTAWVLSGKRNHYKHVLAGTRNASTGQWTTDTVDYLSSPCSVQTGNYYNNSESWFKEQANQRIQTGILLDDLPW